MAARAKVSAEAIIACYNEHRNIKIVAKILAMNPGSVHERLRKLGVVTPPSHFTPFSEEEKDRLRREYVIHRDAQTLDELALSMGRLKTTLALAARKMGLISKNGVGKKSLKTGVWEYMSEERAQEIWDAFKAQRMGLGQFCRKYGFGEVSFWKTMRKYFGDEYESIIESKAPKQSLYRVGRQLEYQIRDELKTFGYFLMRSPASKSPIDLVAIRKGEVLFVQCKKSAYLGPDEWNDIYRLAVSVGAKPLLATKHESGRGNKYWLLNGEKDGSKRAQPFSLWVPVRQGEME